MKRETRRLERSDERDETRPVAGRLGPALLGAKAGFVATIVMTAFRLPISRSLPPTDEFWARYVRRDGAEGNLTPAIVLHLLYGSLAGVVYVVAVPGPSTASEARGEVTGVVTAVAYSLVLSAFGSRVVLGDLLDQHLDPDERLVFHLGHLVYGITLGAWIGSRATD